jgi:hypothetical protein
MSSLAWNELFVYDSESGKLFWKIRPAQRVHIGDEAGSPDNQGYLRVRHQGKFHKVHRIIWKMFYGPIPPGYCIDHINGNPSDNRLENLRLATRSENRCNSKKPRTNTSGLKGAFWNKKTQKWKAQIRILGRQKHLGYFLTAEEAHAAYLAAANIYHGAFARSR